MYTILLNSDNELITTHAEKVMERSNLFHTLCFLVDPGHNGFNIPDFTVFLKYKTPVTNTCRIAALKPSQELYHGKLAYQLPFGTNLTAEPGKVEVSLMFTAIDLNPDGSFSDPALETEKAYIPIIPVSTWSYLIPDDALDPILQIAQVLLANGKYLEEAARIYDQTKADGLRLDHVKKELQLTSHGEPINEPVDLNHLGDEVAEATTAGLTKVIT